MDEQLRQFMRQGLGIREVLQIVEDELLAKRFDDFMVATARRSFHWMTVEWARARASAKKKPKKELSWQALRMRGASMQSLGIVYALDEAGAIKKAIEKYAVAPSLQNRIIVRPRDGD
jgi:hypothetical protein